MGGKRWVPRWAAQLCKGTMAGVFAAQMPVRSARGTQLSMQMSAQSSLTDGKRAPTGLALPREPGIAPFEEEGQNLPFDSYLH